MNTASRDQTRFPGSVKLRSLLALALILGLTWLLVSSPLFQRTPPLGTHLTDVHSVAEFQRVFNADTGTPRLVLILSPT